MKKSLHPILNELGLAHSSWIVPLSSQAITSINPANGNVIANVATTSSAAYEKMIQSAQQAFLDWRAIPAPKRGHIIREIGNLLREKKSMLGSLISLEMGKSKQEGDGEVQEMIDMADLAVGQSRMMYGKTIVSERAKHRLQEQWHPLGLVGVITAFNFPMAVWAWNAFLAAICGNVVIWKPSSAVPLCAIAVQQLCDEVLKKNQLPPIFSLLLSHDATLLNHFIDDERIALVSFTGSSAVGRHINQRVASRMGKVILECSGNNAVIVDETADLKLVTPSVVFGALGTAGQRCTTTRRLFVSEKQYDEVSEKLISAYKKITIGDPLDEKNLMGPLINEKAVHDFEEAVEKAKQAGGAVLFGGEVIKQPGYFVKPTLIKAKNEWPIVQAETFAPILYLIPYKTLDHAIQMQNDVRQGLSSALFTNNMKNAELFLSYLGSDCGIANINIGTAGAEIGGAFGGEKETGGGREAGSDAWKAYMRRQTNTVNWGDALPLAQGIRFDF